MRLLALFALLFCLPSMASIVPKNDRRISTMSKSGITKAQFEVVIDRLEKLYSPVVEARGGHLKFNRLWSDSTVNSDASQEGDQWIINSYGGLARYKGITQDGYANVACHELGHHLGGAPKYRGEQWASNEGQADYFSSLKCMKKYIEVAKLEGDEGDWENQAASDLAKKQCADGHPNQAGEIAVCIRSYLAAKVLAGVLADLGEEPVPSLETPDKSVVKETQDEHPIAQCRLDTYMAGSVCNRDINEPLDESDPKPGTCVDQEIGARPRCWFAP